MDKRECLGQAFDPGRQATRLSVDGTGGLNLLKIGPPRLCFDDRHCRGKHSRASFVGEARRRDIEFTRKGKYFIGSLPLEKVRNGKKGVSFSLDG